MTKKVRVAPNLAIAGPFRSGAAVAPSEERCSHRERLKLCHTRLRVWQKSRGRGGKSPAPLVSSILNATRYKGFPDRHLCMAGSAGKPQGDDFNSRRLELARSG
ncbi:MAG: hypothetical protein ABSF90_25690 [Syntrophobacteraceae bacterium]|jgi:hypothetical protein